MKWTVITFFFVMCLTNAEYVQEKRGVLRRATRHAVRLMFAPYLREEEQVVIFNCNKHKNLSYSEKKDLKDSFEEMKKCVEKFPIFVTSKQNYLHTVEECSKELIKKVKNCLATNQQYYPDLILEQYKSMISFLYDDSSLIVGNEVYRCVRTFKSSIDIRIEYMECVIAVIDRIHDDENIPISQKKFCNGYVSSTRCFTDTLRNNCDKNKKIDKFLTDFLRATTQPCESAYQTPYLDVSKETEA